MNYKKGSAAIWVVGAVVILGGVFYFTGIGKMDKVGNTEDHVLAEDDKVMMEQKKEQDSMKNDSMVKDDSMMMQKPEGTEMEQKSVSTGSYEVYEAAKLSLAKDGKVVLFFNASWCPSCRAVDKELKANALPAGVSVLAVDYDKYLDLKKKYGVTYQHTFVQVDMDGNMIKKWSGGDMAKIISEVK